jgi:hypothetical protein
LLETLAFRGGALSPWSPYQGWNTRVSALDPMRALGRPLAEVLWLHIVLHPATPLKCIWSWPNQKLNNVLCEIESRNRNYVNYHHYQI